VEKADPLQCEETGLLKGKPYGRMVESISKMAAEMDEHIFTGWKR